MASTNTVNLLSTKMLNLLVVGAPRSGTSLLCALLGRQDGIALAHEDLNLGWQKLVGHQVIGVKLCVPNQILLEPPPKHLLVYLSARARLNRYLRNAFQRRFFPKPIRPGRLSIRDFQQLENWRIIATLRDPHEVIASIKSRGKQPEKEAIYRYRTAILCIHRIWSEQPARIDVVDFDSFVSQPNQVIEALCNKLGVAFDDRRVDGFTRNYGERGIDASRAKWRTLEQRLCHPVFARDPNLAAAFTELAETARD